MDSLKILQAISPFLLGYNLAMFKNHHTKALSFTTREGQLVMWLPDDELAIFPSPFLFITFANGDDEDLICVFNDRGTKLATFSNSTFGLPTVVTHRSGYNLPTFCVTFSNGDSYVTSMAVGTTLYAAEEYFLHQKFTREDLQTGVETTFTVVKVERVKPSLF